MIPRKLQVKLQELASYYPVVVVTGPRQSGKTTLCQNTFPDKAYVSLESLDIRDFAHSDPRGFLAEYREGAIIDEIQQVPELLSYLQSEVDSEPATGRFILTGSQHFSLSQAISQSLAGRCGILTLLAPDLEELGAFPSAPTDLYSTLWQGAYPRIFDRNIPAHQWLADYITTYIQRDVRQVINVGDLLAFSGFLKLCAGRTGQEINLSSLGNDAGISHNTARAWLSILETSYIIHRLPAWHSNIRKQVVKAPKLHFFDSGLVCHLLGIRELEQLRHHPLRGAIFESWVVAELYKGQSNTGQEPNMFHYRESRGPEIDLMINRGDVLHAIEIKSGATASTDFFKHFRNLPARLEKTSLPAVIQNHVIYGGEDSQQRSQAQLLSWKDTLKLL
jgi:predicted AAA+ superfamily ATPase